MSTGRNDPCPCGSGRKYKKCHGMTAGLLSVPSAAPSPEAARATMLKALDVDVARRLVQFASRRVDPRWLDTAIEDYLGIDRQSAEQELELGIPGAFHFLPATRAGDTLADLWLADQGARLSSDVRLLLDAYTASWLSIWEVREVTPGVGSLLADLLTGEERFVHDVRSSHSLTVYDTLLPIVLDCGGVSFFGGVHHQPLPPRTGDAVLRDARRMCRVRTRPVSREMLQRADTQQELIGRWRREVNLLLTRPAPTMQNTDGDPLQLTTDDFDVIGSREAVAERLRSLPGAEEPEEDGSDIVFAITKPGNAQHREWSNTVVARIVLTRQRLRIETNSTRRANALRASVQAHVGGGVRFRLRQETNTSALMESARASAGSRRATRHDPQPPEVTAALREFRSRYMTAWLDDSIPALDGLTPRHAATLPRMRSRLEALLKEFEQHEAELPSDERIDIGGLRDALGLVAQPRGR
jgi:hypothetical protein